MAQLLLRCSLLFALASVSSLATLTDAAANFHTVHVNALENTVEIKINNATVYTSDKLLGEHKLGEYLYLVESSGVSASVAGRPLTSQKTPALTKDAKALSIFTFTEDIASVVPVAQARDALARDSRQTIYPGSCCEAWCLFGDRFTCRVGVTRVKTQWTGTCHDWSGCGDMLSQARNRCGTRTYENWQCWMYKDYGNGICLWEGDFSTDNAAWCADGLLNAFSGGFYPETCCAHLVRTDLGPCAVTWACNDNNGECGTGGSCTV